MYASYVAYKNTVCIALRSFRTVIIIIIQSCAIAYKIKIQLSTTTVYRRRVCGQLRQVAGIAMDIAYIATTLKVAESLVQGMQKLISYLLPN